MPREDFFHVLDSVARRCNPHDVFLIVSGGEPLMRDDLELCGQEFHRRGFPWGMVTNGLYLTADRLQGLVKAGLGSVALSLDGLEADHNWLRCHPQSFERASEAIDLLVHEPHIIYDVVTCVNQRNYDQLPQIRDFLIGKGVKDWRLFPIFPMGRAANDPSKIGPVFTLAVVSLGISVINLFVGIFGGNFSIHSLIECIPPALMTWCASNVKKQSNL